jgi:hypothetical protein
MNKKFFTLIAGALLLATSFGTANAQLNIAVGQTVGSFPKFPDSDGNLYQLQTAANGLDYVLVVRANGELGIDTLAVNDERSLEYGETLWCLEFTEAQYEGQNPKVDFTNRSKGYLLRVSEEDVVTPANIVSNALNNAPVVDVRGGSLGGWGFSLVYKDKVNNGSVLYTYFKPDSVLLLAVKNGTDSVIVIKDAADEVVNKGGAYVLPTLVDGGYPGGNVTPLLFTIKTPASLTLTAAQFNTIMNTQEAKAHKLTFLPDKKNTSVVNPWSDFNLLATTAPGAAGWLNFAQALPNTDGKLVDSTKFLRVDTSYINTTGNKYLKFVFDTIYQNGVRADNVINQQYDFQVRYDVSKDSISIQVRQVRENPNILVPWPTTDNTLITDANTASPWNNIVKLQDLVVEDEIRVVTIGAVAAETKIQLGLSCIEAPGSTLTSLGNDVYIIHNKRGQVLGVPIYTDSIPVLGGGVQWITYSTDNVDPKFIPAYQWIVRKIRDTNEAGRIVSPVSITNREFPNIRQNSVQFYKGEETTSLYGAAILPTSDYFTPVPKKQKEDKYLGYSYISKPESDLNTYDLNYFHGFNVSYYLGQSSADTTLVVKTGHTQFKILPVATPNAAGATPTVQYGYNVTSSDTAAIKDLVQLERAAYRLQIGNKGFTINREGRYALAPASRTDAAFFLKTNNTTEGDKHFYALLDTAAIDDSSFSYEKVGISDDNLWAFAQVQKESRTSAFHPEVYTSPLYRRFDNAIYPYGGGPLDTVREPFGTETGPEADAPVWLKFTKQNNPGYEFLFENSLASNEYRQGVTKPISFLGLYNISQKPETDKLKYTFYVDTAYSARPATAGLSGVKTAKPQYMLALRPEILPADSFKVGGYRYLIDGKGDTVSKIWDEEVKSYLPAMTKGLYLFNAWDSIGVRNLEYEGKAAYGAQGDTRLAFVEGVHRADTFYVLTDDLKKRNLIELQQDSTLLWGLNPIYKHYLGENTHFEPRFEHRSAAQVNAGATTHEPIYVGTGADKKLANGKSMVFQFRLLTNAPNAKRTFLIETERAAGEPQIGPANGKWVKIQNGVPIVSDWVGFYTASQQSGAELFNVAEGVVNGATAIDPVAASEVKVISEVGAIQILNAAGKTVAVSNVLGQTVASTVLPSDNARVVLPKGIVIVSVEGAPAIKAIVK